VLIGRRTELDRITALLDRARARQGSALVIVGDPGIGKTALLEAASESAGGMLVAAATGVESEATLPYAALSEICGPLLAGIAELPAPQADAVGAALALAPAPTAPGDRLAVFSGFLGLLRIAARDQPVLVSVDDAHWLDSASAECLGYAARRIEGDRVAIIAARRPGTEPEGRLGDDLPELTLGGLGREAALELVRGSGAELTESGADALLEVALGNPLALLELPALMSEDQRRGVAPLDPPPTPNGALGEAFEVRIERAGERAREALVVAAAASDRALTPVVAACRELGVDDEALERAEAEGLVEIEGDRISFSHPLLRAIAYRRAPADARRRAHRALAAHTEGDARAWHLATAAIGIDPGAAEALDEAARRATSRGAHAAAADALERAAQLSEGPSRSGRLFAAGLAAALGGAFDRAAALLESAADTNDPKIRATVNHLLAMVRLTGGVGTALDNHELLITEAEGLLEADPAAAAALFADAGVAAAVAGFTRLVLDASERALAALPSDASATTRCQVHSINGMGLAMRCRAAEALPAYERALELLPQIDFLSHAPQSIALALGACVSTGQESALRDGVSSLAAVARKRRALGILPYLQQLGADAAYRLGDWETAERESNDAVVSAELSGQAGPLSIALAVRARILAARGDEAAARSSAETAIELGGPPGNGASVFWASAASGFLELSLGRSAEAIEALEQTRVLSELAELEDPLIIPWAPDLVEAYARSGRMGDAQALAEELAERAKRSGAPLAAALAERCSAIARTTERAGFERALDHHDAASQPFERARTLLAFGSRLHRDRRRVEARERLRESLAIFERLGANPWAEQARAELRAAGATPRRDVDDSDELTPQELRVAFAVARGAKNREVAAELFLSPKTVEFHLGRIYRKLGIHSRTELAARVADGALSDHGGAAATRPADAGLR
jgi:DNA-binding CsgD family transcriptional regulator